MVKSGLTNDDLIRLYEVAFAPGHVMLEKMPHPPPNLSGQEVNDWYENNEESKRWKQKYELSGRKSCAAYLRLRWQIGRRIGAHLIASGRNFNTGPDTGMVDIHVFPRSQFPTRASVREHWRVPFPPSHKEDFPRGAAHIYFLTA